MIKTALDQITPPPVGEIAGLAHARRAAADGWIKLGFDGKPEF